MSNEHLLSLLVLISIFSVILLNTNATHSVCISICLAVTHACTEGENWTDAGKTNSRVETFHMHISSTALKAMIGRDNKEDGAMFVKNNKVSFVLACERRQSGVCKMTEPHHKRGGKNTFFEWVNGKSKTQTVSILLGYTEPMQEACTAYHPSLPLAPCVCACACVCVCVCACVYSGIMDRN